MALIKLSFLQQALQLSYDDENGTLIKKKRINGPVAVKSEPVQSLQLKPSVAENKSTGTTARLYVDSQPSMPAVLEEKQFVDSRPLVKEAAIHVLKEEQVILSSTESDTAVAMVKAPTTAKKNLLHNLRDKHVKNLAVENKKEAVAITAESLKQAWSCFIEKLKKDFKHSVVTVFNQAELAVINEAHFSIRVSSSLEQKFIDQEKMTLLEYLKDCFNNKNIGFTIHITEQSKHEGIAETPLTTREKYLRIIEQYPMVKELKDRLKLELDY
jgi:DNA polymerase-3 subunit gamma/tau